MYQGRMLSQLLTLSRGNQQTLFPLASRLFPLSSNSKAHPSTGFHSAGTSQRLPSPLPPPQRHCSTSSGTGKQSNAKYWNNFLPSVLLMHKRGGDKSGGNKRGQFFGIGTLGGLGILYGAVLVTKGDNNPDSSQISAVFPEHENKAEVRISRKIVNPLDTSGLNLRLYQYQSCPFCCKVRAALDYYGLSYEVVEVNPVSRSQLKFSEYRKVPLLVVQGRDNKELRESSFIVSLVRTFTLDPKRDFQEIVNFYPHHKSTDDKGKVSLLCENKYFVMFQEQVKTKEGIANKREEREWREWVDNVFIHVISPNVYRSLREAKETFNWFSKFSHYDDVFPAYEKFMVVNIGAFVMWMIAKRLKKRHQLKPDVRESLYDAARQWKWGLGPRQFMGGNEPNLADLALYGAMTSFEGCRAFSDMLENTDIGPWFNSVKAFVTNHHGAREFIQNLT